jgi:hypothetical protein
VVGQTTRGRLAVVVDGTVVGGVVVGTVEVGPTVVGTTVVGAEEVGTVVDGTVVDGMLVVGGDPVTRSVLDPDPWPATTAREITTATATTASTEDDTRRC